MKIEKVTIEYSVEKGGTSIIHYLHFPLPSSNGNGPVDIPGEIKRELSSLIIDVNKEDFSDKKN